MTHDTHFKALWDAMADKVAQQYPRDWERDCAVATFAVEACKVFTMAGFDEHETRAKTDERVEWFKIWMGYR